MALPPVQVQAILNAHARYGDIFYSGDHVLALVDQVKGALGAVPAPKSVTLPEADRLGNGAELNAMIELLRAEGYGVQTKEVGYYHRIVEIVVSQPVKMQAAGPLAP